MINVLSEKDFYLQFLKKDDNLSDSEVELLDSIVACVRCERGMLIINNWHIGKGTLYASCVDIYTNLTTSSKPKELTCNAYGFAVKDITGFVEIFNCSPYSNNKKLTSREVELSRIAALAIQTNFESNNWIRYNA